MRIVILANEIGDRLWPLTNNKLPKALLSLYSPYTLLEETLVRCLPVCGDPSDLYVVTTKAAKTQIKNLKLASQFNVPSKNIIAVPEEADLAQVAYQLVDLFYNEGIEDDEPVGVVPSDQFFWPGEGFLFHLNNTVKGCSTYPDKVLIFTMQPGVVAGNMDYVRVNWDRVDNVGIVHDSEDEQVGVINTLTLPVVDSIFLPDAATAESLITEGWLWDLKTWIASARTFKLLLDGSDYQATISRLISEQRVQATLANKVIWSVMDNWAAIKYLTYDETLFSHIEDPRVHSIQSSNNLVKIGGKNKEVVLMGVDNLIVIDTDDKLLIGTPEVVHEHL